MKGQTMKITSQNRAKLAQLRIKITQIRAKLGKAMDLMDDSLPKKVWILACKKGYKFAKILQSALYERDLLKNNIALNQIFDLSNECDSCVIEEFFKRYNSDEKNAEIFDKTLLVAQIRAVKIIFVAQSGGAKYLHEKNLIQIFANDLTKSTYYLLHTLIHSVSVETLSEFKSANLKSNSNESTAEIRTIKDLQDLYEIAKPHEMTLKVWCNRKCYGFANLKEFLAELSNPLFRDSLAKIGILDSTLKAYFSFLDSHKSCANQA